MQKFGNEYNHDGIDNETDQIRPKYKVQPHVEAKAKGGDDSNVYLQPKETAHKIRRRSDLNQMLCGIIDKELLAVKFFYFFFYSAFGSLFPLMGVYFKQIGMNPWQCGLLIGTRPFIKFLSVPFWGSYANRYKKGKMFLLASLATWIIFTLPLVYIQPPATGCIHLTNATAYELNIPDGPQNLKRSISFDELKNVSFGNQMTSNNPEENYQRVERAIRFPEAGQSPFDVSHLLNYDSELHGSWVFPRFTSIVYRTDDIQKVFLLLLLLIVIGEFLSAPTITLADSALITILGKDSDRYKLQRISGSLGWGLAMLLIGIVLDHFTSFPDHPCGPQLQEKMYGICFVTFSVLMGVALITATQITFKYDQFEELAPQDVETQNQPSLAAPTNGAAPLNLSQTTRAMAEWVTVLRKFKDLKSISFLFVAWVIGFGIGLTFTFLFWHLQDYGGSPTLFGVASVINQISEIIANFFAFRLITLIGHVKILCLGLIGNILRFLYISYLTNPWWVLPIEFMQGITHAVVWAACCSYIAHNTPQQLRNSAKGVLQGVHYGLGRGCGAIIGGLFVYYFGTRSTFYGYGIICIFVLIGYILINVFCKEKDIVANILIREDPHHVAEDTSQLAPDDVPINITPKVPSSSQ